MSESPTPPRLTVGVTQEQARAVLENAATQLAPFRAAMQRFAERYVENLHQITDAFRPIVDYAEAHPEALEQWRRERESAEQVGSCHCLCGIHHREQPAIECDGIAEPGLTMRFDSPTVGTQQVAMCLPCYGFHQERRIEQFAGAGFPGWQQNFLRGALSAQQPGLREPLPVTEAITDTCACACYASHPGTPGVCEAASDMQLDGQPLCSPCFDAAGAESKEAQR